jgi:hypothetical protein
LFRVLAAQAYLAIFTELAEPTVGIVPTRPLRQGMVRRSKEAAYFPDSIRLIPRPVSASALTLPEWRTIGAHFQP